MTIRENLRAVLHYESFDHMPVLCFGYWKETLEKWIAEGHLPAEAIGALADGSAQHRAKRDDALGIVIRAPRIPVNKENRFYLQFLDLLNMYDDVPVDAEDPYLLLGRFVQARGLDYGTLLHLADTHYNGNTIMKLAHVAGRQGV